MHTCRQGYIAQIKRRLWLSLVLLMALMPLSAQQRCGVDFVPVPRQAEPQALQSRSVITIPVVVHIVWQQPVENISDEQVQSQLSVLNQDFRALNAEAGSVHPLFRELVADTELAFCLVATTRTQTSVEGIATSFSGGRRRVCYTDLGGRDAIAPSEILNIWVAGRNDGVLGSATFPEEGLIKPMEDGLFISPKAFGTTGTVESPFHLGRTCTHELGHYLNLQHLWGSGTSNFDCDQDDGVGDTPLQADTYRNTCPGFLSVSCGSPDMHMNFMNYTDDACMALFTPGQKSRMRAALEAYRPGLLMGSCEPVAQQPSPVAALPIRLLGHPVQDELWLELPGSSAYEVAIFGPAGRLVVQPRKVRGPLASIDCRSLPAGIYFLKIQQGREMQTKKLIIAKR